MIENFRLFIKKHNVILVAYMILMTYMLYKRDVDEVSVNKFVFVFFTLLASVLCNANTLMSVIMFTIPLMCGLPGNYILPIWILCIVKNAYSEKNRSIVPAISFATIIIIFEFSHYVFYPYETDYIELANYYSSLLLVGMLCQGNLRINYSNATFSFCIGCCVLLTLIFLMFIKGGDATMMVQMYGRMGGDIKHAEEGMMLKANANVIGLMSSSAIACAFAMFYYKCIRFYQLAVIFMLCFFGGLFSVSRTWALVLALIIAMYVFLLRRNKWFGYFTVAFIVLGIFYFYVSNPEIFDIFIKRFTGDNIETGGDRTRLFAAYNNFMLDHILYFLFGTSVQFYKEVCGIDNSVHNGLQQIFVSYGIIGVFFFMFAYWKTLVSNYTHKQYISIIPMISVLVFLQTLQTLNPIYNLYPIMAAFFVMKMVRQKHIV